MKYTILSICLAAVFALSACGSTIVMTPEYIDPADSISSPSSEISEPVSVPSEETADSEPAVSSAPEESSEPSEESSEPLSEIVLTVDEDYLKLLWDDGQFTCSRRVLVCSTDELTGAGTLNYDLIQMTDGPAAEAFNACWTTDLTEWEESVRYTALSSAELARETGETPLPYSISLSASLWQRGELISVARDGLRISGEERFAFVSNSCFVAVTGEPLSLWQLFTVPEEEAAPRILDALNIQAEVDGYTGFDAASLFAPTDFCCSDGGFVFYLTTGSGITDLTVPYENFMDILAYPLWE